VVLPFKRVEGDFKGKLKKVDYLGSLVMLAASILILLPLSWYVCCSAGVQSFSLIHIQGRNAVRLEIRRLHRTSCCWCLSHWRLCLHRDESGNLASNSM
jgi:hypothetical protein